MVTVIESIGSVVGGEKILLMEKLSVVPGAISEEKAFARVTCFVVEEPEQVTKRFIF